MEIFAWNPAAGAESIDAFNARVAEVCRSEDTAVVDTEPSLAGDTLVLSLTEAGDLPVQLPLAILPIVRVLTPKQQLEMEKTLLEMREQIDAKLGEQESIVKMSVRAGPTTAYAIFIVGLAVLQGA